MVNTLLILSCDWCREALVCGANDTLPEQSQESADSGFSCNWVDTEEFVTIDCNCTVPTCVLYNF